MGESLNFLEKSMNSLEDFSSELRESLMKVVAQVWADPFMKERVKVNFFSSMLYTPLLTIRYTCTEFNQTIWWGFHQSYWVDLDGVLWVYWWERLLILMTWLVIEVGIGLRVLSWFLRVNG